MRSGVCSPASTISAPCRSVMLSAALVLRRGHLGGALGRAGGEEDQRLGLELARAARRRVETVGHRARARVERGELGFERGAEPALERLALGVDRRRDRRPASARTGTNGPAGSSARRASGRRAWRRRAPRRTRRGSPRARPRAPPRRARRPPRRANGRRRGPASPRSARTDRRRARRGTRDRRAAPRARSRPAPRSRG